MQGIKVLLVAAVVFVSATAAAQERHFDAPFSVKIQNKHGFMDESCRMVVPAQFDATLDFTEGLAAVEVNGRWGYIDQSGKFVIQPQFAGAWHFSDGLASVKLNEESPLWGFIDKSGTVVIEPQFGMPLWFSEGLVEGYGQENGVLNTPLGYVDKAGKYVIQLSEPGFGIEFLMNFSEGLAPVSMRRSYADGSVGSGEWGYIDHNGKWVIPHRFSGAEGFREGLAGVADEHGIWGYIDKSGQFVIPPRFEGAKSFSEGIAAVRISGRWGFVDRSGAVVIAPQFQQVSEFSGGRVAIFQGRKLGYINRAGTVVIAPTLDSGTEFIKGVAAVSTAGRYSVIDVEGHTKCELTKK